MWMKIRKNICLLYITNHLQAALDDNYGTTSFTNDSWYWYLVVIKLSLVGKYLFLYSLLKVVHLFQYFIFVVILELELFFVKQFKIKMWVTISV